MDYIIFDAQKPNRIDEIDHGYGGRKYVLRGLKCPYRRLVYRREKNAKKQNPSCATWFCSGCGGWHAGLR